VPGGGLPLGLLVWQRISVPVEVGSVYYQEINSMHFKIIDLALQVVLVCGQKEVFQVIVIMTTLMIPTIFARSLQDADENVNSSMVMPTQRQILASKVPQNLHVTYSYFAWTNPQNNVNLRNFYRPMISISEI
jgi:hypothetical protein